MMESWMANIGHSNQGQYLMTTWFYEMRFHKYENLQYYFGDHLSIKLYEKYIEKDYDLKVLLNLLELKLNRSHEVRYKYVHLATFNC